MRWQTAAYGHGAIPPTLLLHTGLGEDDTGSPDRLGGEAEAHGRLRI